MTAFIVFALGYVYIFAKAYQQLNVMHYRWAMIPVFSYIMGYIEWGTVGIGVVDVVDNGLHRILVLGFASGTGGWLGSWTALKLFKR